MLNAATSYLKKKIYIYIYIYIYIDSSRLSSTVIIESGKMANEWLDSFGVIKKRMPRRSTGLGQVGLQVSHN